MVVNYECRCSLIGGRSVLQYLLKEGLLCMCCGMFIFHVTLEWLGAASWRIHSEAQQGLVPP